MITGTKIEAGDVLIGLSSTGCHSNGYSLVRKLVSDFDTPFAGKTIGEVLLTPTRIYVRPVMDVLSVFGESVHGMVHITGGGFYENVPRMYAKGKNLVSVIKKNSWPKPAIFDELIRRGADSEGVWGTFNMGIGFILAVKASDADAIIARFNEKAASFETEPYTKAGAVPLKAYKIGHVEAATKDLGEDLKGSHEATKLI
jgi:phosphoribosylformylglycinamidine cyclo-ligase